MSHVLGGGKIAEVGEILDLPDRVARERIHYGRVEEVPPEAPISGASEGARPPSPPGGGAAGAGTEYPAGTAPPAPDPSEGEEPAEDDDPAPDDPEASPEDDAPSGRARSGKRKR
jgi:hypothetical protein